MEGSDDFIKTSGLSVMTLVTDARVRVAVVARQ